MDKAKKNQLKKIIAWVSLAALVAVLAVMPLLARSEQEQEGPVASILSGTVQKGSIEVGLRGGGTLSAGKAEAVKLPAGVKITQFLVKNGDIVEAGDPVAAVDKVSVMTAILGVRETLEYLQDEMADAKEEKASTTISATAGGLVKQVFAQKGDKVEDVMLTHGALAVLSLDGMMAVELETKTAYAAGDTLQVVCQGVEANGRVESNLDGTLVVTVEDTGYDVGASAQVYAQGVLLGEGSLYVHNAWRATAFNGTVSTVNARENKEVYEGSTLFTLTDTAFSGTLDSLASLHREYEQLLQDLFSMHESGVITAPQAGEISGVDADSPLLLSAIDGEQGWFVDLLSAPQEEAGWTVVLLSNTEDACTKEENCKAEKHEDGCPMKCTGREGCTAGEHDPGCAVFCTMLPDCANLNHKTGCLGVCTGNESCQSARSWEYHQKTCVKRCISDQDEDPATTCDSEVHCEACIENCTKSQDCPALTHKEGCYYHGVTYTAVALQVKQVTLEGLLVVYGNTTYQVTPEGSSWKLVDPDQITDVFPGEGQLLAVEDPSAYGAGDILLIVTGTNSSGQMVYQDLTRYRKGQEDVPAGPGGMGGFPGFGDLSGMFGAMGGMMGGYGSMTPEFELYDLEGEPLLTVTDRQTVTLTITLDQRDIAKAYLGQRAQVKVNALKGQSFEAEVTDLGMTGTNSGGSSKFALELTLPMGEDMIPGMSATAWLPLNTRMDVLTIPVKALCELEGRTVVFTALDEKTGEPCAPVEVTVGASDGEWAEVLTGLENGAVYHYSYYDTLELSTEVESDGISFGG